MIYNKEKIRIAHITDLHIDDFISKTEKINGFRNFQKIIENIIKEEINYVVMTGDYGNSEIFPLVTDLLVKNDISYDYILGNHDEYSEYSSYISLKYNTNKSGLFYNKIINNDLFLYLDSSSSKINDYQFEWLKSEIEKLNFKRIIIFSHHPILNCGDTTMDNLYPLQEKKKLNDYLVSLNSDIFIFSGHYHAEHSIIQKNIQQFVTPSALLQVEKYSDEISISSKDFGYRVIDIEEKINSKVKMFSENNET